MPNLEVGKVVPFERMTAAQYRARSKEVASASPLKAGGNKYKATRTRLGDQVFDSAKEAKTYILLEQSKVAHNLSERVIDIERSRKYLLIPAQGRERACHYIADFFIRFADGREEVWDTKSYITRKNPLYVVKRKLMLDRYGISIVEV